MAAAVAVIPVALKAAATTVAATTAATTAAATVATTAATTGAVAATTAAAKVATTAATTLVFEVSAVSMVLFEGAIVFGGFGLFAAGYAVYLGANLGISLIQEACSEKSKENKTKNEHKTETCNENCSKTASKTTKTIKSKVVTDLDSEENSKKNGNKKVENHLLDRFLRYIRFGGMLQRVSQETEIKRDEIVEVGRSLYKDKSSGRGNSFHAAHVVRMNQIGKLEKYEDLYAELKHFLGHTQIVPRYANLGIGQQIDWYQEKNFHLLNQIDFSNEITVESSGILRQLRDEYIKILESYSKTSNNDLNDEVQIALSWLKEMSLEDIFQHGNDGYNGRHTQSYN